MKSQSIATTTVITLYETGESSSGSLVTNLPLQLKAQLEAVHFLLPLVTIPINRLVFKANVIKGADQGDCGKTEDIRSRHDEEGLLGGKLQKTIWNASSTFNGFSICILMRYQCVASFPPTLFPII